jgi:hypothetical protein
MPGQKRVFALDVPGIHVFNVFNDVPESKTWMAGIGERKATPSFRRLCPAMKERALLR